MYAGGVAAPRSSLMIDPFHISNSWHLSGISCDLGRHSCFDSCSTGIVQAYVSSDPSESVQLWLWNLQSKQFFNTPKPPANLRCGWLYFRMTPKNRPGIHGLKSVWVWLASCSRLGACIYWIFALVQWLISEYVPRVVCFQIMSRGTILTSERKCWLGIHYRGGTGTAVQSCFSLILPKDMMADPDLLDRRTMASYRFFKSYDNADRLLICNVRQITRAPATSSDRQTSRCFGTAFSGRQFWSCNCKSYALSSRQPGGGREGIC